MLLEELDAADLAVHSRVLHRGFIERLALAAAGLTDAELTDAGLTDAGLAGVAEHRSCAGQIHRLERLRCAARLRRWLASAPDPAVTSGGAGLRRHATELAWVDRALGQVRAGDPDPRVARALDDACRPAERHRAEIGRASCRERV